MFIFLTYQSIYLNQKAKFAPIQIKRMSTKPSIPKGTRDFSPVQVIKRNYIFDTIRKIFIKYGYQPIETPAMEKLTSLMGKYGDEGDKLLFKVLNNGDFLNKSDATAFAEKNTTAFTHSVSKRGLRYDLTVPFARYVVMHQNDITFPFKRYQIQPVWRADRPQKGRYQEFYQCDADVVGSNSLMLEAELAQIYDAEKYAKSQKYQRTKYKFSWISGGFSILIMFFILLF